MVATLPSEARAQIDSPQERCDAAYHRIDDGLDAELRRARREHVLEETTRELAQCEKDLGADHVSTARMRRIHAYAERLVGHYDVAKVEGERALAVLERELGPMSHDVAIALHVLASIALSLQRYEEAIGLSERSLKIREATKDEPKEIAAEWSLIAGAHTRLSHRDPAIHAGKKALEIIESAYGAESEEVGSEAGSLGKTYYYFRDYDEAERLLVKSIDIIEKSSPDTDLLGSKSNDLAVVYHYGRNDLERAEPLYRRAVALHEKHSPNTMNMAQGWINLGTLLCQKGNFTEGRPLYDRGMARMKEIAGRETPEMGWARDYFKAHVK